MNFSGLILALAAASLLIASPVHAQTAMTGADIQKALSDKTVRLSCVDGTSGSGRYTMGKNFGIITGTYSPRSGAPASDTGHVRADGDQLCLRFEKLNQGLESCFGVVQKGPGKFAFTVVGGLVTACEVSQT